MRTSFSILLLLSMLLAGTYWFNNVAAICRVPVEYSIGTFDERFGISEEEARLAVTEAEAVWEDATGRNLFSYAEDAAFKVNFIYDARQQTADEEDVFRELLDKKAEVNEEFESSYAELVARYKALELEYQEAKAAYERRLDAYNQEVDRYNAEGGAPPEAYEELQAEQQSLRREEAELNAQVRELNQYVDEINRLGERGSELIEQYNENVNSYNEAFGTEREFTQGDYQRNAINIYTFEDRNELVTVLAHEFGHALHLDHVENRESVMHYLMGGQPNPVTLTAEDLGEFAAECGYDEGFLSRLQSLFAAWR